MAKSRKVKQIRLHREGTATLWLGLGILVLTGILGFYCLMPLCAVGYLVLMGILIVVYGIIVNFFRCPLRIFPGDTSQVVVAPADGHVVVIEETEEPEYFGDKRLMISIFMSVTNVHANWFPVEGMVKMVKHHNGNFHKAWLPKASTENERSTVVIETPSGHDVLVRQVAGAVARRIVTYAKQGEECFIDEHMGFIKFGSRVDVYLPLDSEVCVTLHQATSGNGTVIARLHPKTADKGNNA